MKNFEKYVKRHTGEKFESKVTSISIDVKHYEFVLENELNLSHMVRDLIQSYMESMPKANRRRPAG